MSYSQINKLYDIFKHNQNEESLSEENNNLANWLLDGYLSIKQDLCSLTNTEFFQLSVAAFYQDKTNKALINEFLNRFYQGFESVENLVQENKFITLYFIERAFSVSQQIEKNQSLAHHFFKNESYDSVINFFSDNNSNVLLQDKKFKTQENNNNLVFNMYTESSFNFWVSIFDYYGFDLKGKSDINIWVTAAAYQRLDILHYFEKKQASYTLIEENGGCTPLTYLMKRRRFYDDKTCQIYDFLIKQDKNYIQDYQKEHQKLMEYLTTYANREAIDYLIKNNFDFSTPSFTHYIEKCDNYEVFYYDSEEDKKQNKDYMNQLKQKIICMEKEIIEASMETKSITSRKQKIKL